MKAAILQCDSVPEALQSRFDDYPVMIQRMLEQAAPSVCTDVYACHRGETPESINGYDFYITTGSRSSVFDCSPWIDNLLAFVSRLDREKKKLIGICFGHQLIARACGGKVERSAGGWSVGLARNRIVHRPDWMKEGPGCLKILASHRDQITRLPEDSRVIAQSDFCPCFMVQRGNHFLGIQGHPEWHPEYSRALLHERKAIIPRQRWEKGLASLQQPPDNTLFGQWVVEFVTQS